MLTHKDFIAKAVAEKMKHVYDLSADDGVPTWIELYWWACDELGINVDYLDIDDKLDKYYWEG